MSPPGAGVRPDHRDLLDAWDAGQMQRRAHWAITFLALFEPDGDREPLRALSIGDRDARLIAGRNAVFGRSAGIVQSCPGCGEQLETTLDAAALLVAAPARHEADFTVRVGSCEARFRLPTSVDLMAAADCPDAESAHAALLGRCLIEAFDGGRQVPPSALPPAMLDALSQRMAALDPQADLRINLRCASCGHVGAVVFDIVPFVWAELDAWAERLLREVHLLASAYGWTEASVLSMSDARRRRYVRMAAA